ncbi:MAG: L-glutamate gamma-semialdehyde dehydrogenase [Victivallales bacterium]|nr:L-glutamate gamma-semialdehyde dehydrogenase [Victivallales bacterium]MCF7889106.1 L-glutamate gamma-semialdehyde dehydrogenase [Victivallales bacterium]
MANGIFKPTPASNEPVKSYAPGTPERGEVKKVLDKLCNSEYDIPLFIGGKEIKTGKTAKLSSPSDHSKCFGKYHLAEAKHLEMAIEAAEKARSEWKNLPWEERAGIFLKAAALLSGKYRYLINAATMLGQGKTVHQAEIDAACELIDFLNFNVNYMRQIYTDQPFSPKGTWNRIEYMPLEGFVLAITPFNFTAIGGNLPTSPAMMGNTVLWKPASTAILSSYLFFQILREAGLPDGVINFIPGSGAVIGQKALEHEKLAGVHFTGSTEVFLNVWKTIGNNIHKYKSYPRIVGETGGKDFLIAYKDADIAPIITACVRGAYEYQGQKCSALSRAYLPRTMSEKVIDGIKSQLDTVKMGDVTDFSNFLTAVIDKSSFNNIKSYIDFAKESPEAEIVYGGTCDDSKGYYVEPTVILTSNPHFKTMKEEIFGPVLTIYIYEDDKIDEALDLVDTTSIYALTGAIFATDRTMINKMLRKLEHAAGNFYVNDKPTGSVVGQQPFGGSRGSGTNDKAGSKVNLMRWISMRTIKETFEPPVDYRYPFMDDE